MSEGEDDDSRTEDATEKKISDAIDRGDVPQSRDVSTAVSLMTVVATLVALGGNRTAALANSLSALLDHSGDMRLRSGADAAALFLAVSSIALRFVGAFLALVVTFAILASVSQNAPRLVLQRIAPQASRISIGKGMARIFSRQGFAGFGKSIAKLAIVASVAALALRTQIGRIEGIIAREPQQIAAFAAHLALQLSLAVALSGAAIAMFDLVAARLAWRRRLRMTRHEIKDEMRQAEGDPLLKGRLRSLARDRARRRMIDDVQRATVVLVNPTHYAVALRYVREEGGAPRVVAKGQELLALRIRERAERHAIPIIENPALVRSMYDAVEVDQMIPAAFYRAIAEIINLISKREAAFRR